MFQKRIIWRVGDGSQIKIWDDCWVPRSHNLEIMTPKGNNLVSMVDELVNSMTGDWDDGSYQTDIFG